MRARMIDREIARMLERANQPAGRVAVVEGDQRDVEAAHHMRGAGIDAHVELRAAHERRGLAQAERAGEDRAARAERLRKLECALAVFGTAEHQELARRTTRADRARKCDEIFERPVTV